MTIDKREELRHEIEKISGMNFVDGDFGDDLDDEEDDPELDWQAEIDRADSFTGSSKCDGD